MDRTTSLWYHESLPTLLVTNGFDLLKQSRLSLDLYFKLKWSDFLGLEMLSILDFDDYFKRGILLHEHYVTRFTKFWICKLTSLACVSFSQLTTNCVGHPWCPIQGLSCDDNSNNNNNNNYIVRHH